MKTKRIKIFLYHELPYKMRLIALSEYASQRSGPPAMRMDIEAEIKANKVEFLEDGRMALSIGEDSLNLR